MAATVVRASWQAKVEGLQGGEQLALHTELRANRGGWDQVVYDAHTPVVIPMVKRRHSNRLHLVLFAPPEKDPACGGVARVGCGMVDLLKAVHAGRRQVKLYFEDDEKGTPLRTLTLVDITWVGSRQGEAFKHLEDLAHAGPLLSPAHAQVLRAYRQIQRSFWEQHRQNVHALLPWVEDDTPYPTLGASLPMVFQTFGLTLHDPLHPEPAVVEILLRLSMAAIARVRLQDRAYSRWTEEEMLEVLAEMCTLPARLSLYHRDGPRGDQWRWPTLTPDPNQVLYDCEDGTAWVLRVFYLLSRVDIVEAYPLLVKLQELAQRYHGCLALGTLHLSTGGLTYHAYPVLLDRRACDAWVKQEKLPSSPHPALILESTAWTASCRAYRPAGAEARYDQDPLKDHPQLRRKIPATLVERSHQYGHTHALMLPQYMKCAPDVALVDPQGRTGVPTHDLLNYRGTVRWTTPETKLDHQALTRALEAVRERLPIPAVPRQRLGSTKNSMDAAPPEAYTYWVRKADWVAVQQILEPWRKGPEYEVTSRRWTLWGAQEAYEVMLSPTTALAPLSPCEPDDECE